MSKIARIHKSFNIVLRLIGENTNRLYILWFNFVFLYFSTDILLQSYAAEELYPFQLGSFTTFDVVRTVDER